MTADKKLLTVANRDRGQAPLTETPIAVVAGLAFHAADCSCQCRHDRTLRLRSGLDRAHEQNKAGSGMSLAQLADVVAQLARVAAAQFRGGEHVRGAYHDDAQPLGLALGT